MQGKPLFSILMANYNNGKYLMDAIESVRRQTYANWEIILVDDGSTDDSEQVYKELEKDNRIHIYRNDKNMGCGFTKHRCVELAKGEFCGFLDPDDALIENALELEAKIHLAHPTVSIVYSKCLFCNTDFTIYEYGYLPNFKKGDTYLEHRTHGAMNFASFKKSFYDETDGINSRLRAGVDQDLYFRMEEVGKAYLLDEYTYKYVNVGHEHAISSSVANHVSAWYWNLVARRDAFIRRGLDENPVIEDFKKILDVYVEEQLRIREKEYLNSIIQKELKTTLYKQERAIRSSASYRIGQLLLTPIKWLQGVASRFGINHK